MTHLAHIQLYDVDGVQSLPSVHATCNIEYAYALALDVCRIRTRALSRLNIIRATRSRLERPFQGVGEVYLSFDLQRLDRLGAEEAAGVTGRRKTGSYG